MDLSQRPAKDEADEYFFTYIGKVPGGDIAALLERQSAEYAALLERVGDAQSHSRYEPGKWSVRECAGHVNDTERVFAYRALWFARGLQAPLPSMDQDAAVAHANSESVSMPRLAAEFRAIRAATLALLKTLPAEAWDRRGISSGKTLSVRAAIWIVCGHLEHHMRLFRDKYGVV